MDTIETGTRNQAALASGHVAEEQLDAAIDPLGMVGQGVGGA